MPGRALGSPVGGTPGAAIGDHGDDRDAAQDSQHPRPTQADLAERIEAAHRSAIGAARHAIDFAVICGKLLLQAKKEVGHGAWLAWIDTNLSFGHRQAQKYTRLAEFSAKVPNANSNSHLTIDGALAAIAEPTQKPVRQKPKPTGEKPEEAPAKSPSLIASIRDFNTSWSPASIEAASVLITEEQRADLQHHLPDVIGKLQRLAGPAADAPADEDQEDGDDDDPFAGVPRPKQTSRPKRWAEACQQAMAALEELQELQQECQDWRQTMPENLEGSATAQKLDDLEGIDIQSAIDVIQEAEGADLPLGFGRD